MLLSPPGLMHFRDAMSNPQHMPAAPTAGPVFRPGSYGTLLRAGVPAVTCCLAGGFIELCFNHLRCSYCLPQLTFLHARVLV